MSDYVKGERMSLARLRAGHPTWTWMAQRGAGGFSWEYVGTKEDQRVVVRPYSQLLNRYDGDEGHTVVWHVEAANEPGRLYILWIEPK